MFLTSLSSQGRFLPLSGLPLCLSVFSELQGPQRLHPLGRTLHLEQCTRDGRWPAGDGSDSLAGRKCRC